MSGRWIRLAGLAATLGLTVAIMAGLASAQSDATTGTSPTGSAVASRTLNIYGMGGRDDVAQGRLDYAEGVLGSSVEVSNPVGGFNDQAFLARLASGDVPDLVYVGRGSVGTYAARNAFLPLASCIRSQSIDTKIYRAAALNEVRYKGQLYALPEFTNQITLLVNQDVAKAAGVATADIQTTNWTKLRQANKKLLRIQDGRLTRIGFDPKIPEFFPLWVKWFGKDLISKDGLKAQLNTREAVAALAYAVSLINDHGGWNRFKAFRDTFDFFGTGNPFARNQIGAMPFESFIYNVFADNSPNIDLVAKYFTNRKGGPITIFSGSGWAIPRGREEPGSRVPVHEGDDLGGGLEARSARRASTCASGRDAPFTGLYTANTRADVAVYEDIYQPIGKQAFDDAVTLLVRGSASTASRIPLSPASAEFRQAWLDAINRVLERPAEPASGARPGAARGPGTRSTRPSKTRDVGERRNERHGAGPSRGSGAGSPASGTGRPGSPICSSSRGSSGSSVLTAGPMLASALPLVHELRGRADRRLLADRVGRDGQLPAAPRRREDPARAQEHLHLHDHDGARRRWSSRSGSR